MSRKQDELRAARKTKFLEAFATTGVIQPACVAASVSRSTVRNWREDDEEFDEAYGDALQCAIDAAESELRLRAVEGVEEIIMYKGSPIWKRDPKTGAYLLDDDFERVPYTQRITSDRLLEVYAKANRARYRDKSSLALTGGEGEALIPRNLRVEHVMPDGKTLADYGISADDGEEGDSGGDGDGGVPDPLD